MPHLAIAAIAAVVTVQPQAAPEPASGQPPAGLIAHGSRNDDGPLTAACRPLPSPHSTGNPPVMPDQGGADRWSRVHGEAADEQWFRTPRERC